MNDNEMEVKNMLDKIDKIDKIKGEFDDFIKIISANSDFRKFLSSPTIKKEKKKGMN